MSYTEVALVSPLIPIMLRNVFFVLVMAALAATSAPASTPTPSARAAKPHKNTLSHASAHRPAKHPQAHASAHIAARPASHAAHATRGSSRGPVHNQARNQARTQSHGRMAGHRSLASRRTSPPPRAPQPDPASTTPPAVVPAAVSLRRRAIMPPPLKGSFESLARQNERAEADGLERILDEDDLSNRIAQGLLVPVPLSSALTIDETLPENHRYCRPWTATFLSDLSQAHATRFRHALFVSSAVRTVEYQQELTRYNGNAAAAEGDIVSPHLTGGTIDIAKNGMSRQEIGWMRNWLLAQQLAGMIDVEEEFRQPCFHITVYRNYSSPVPDPVVTRRARRRTASVPAASATPGL